MKISFLLYCLGLLLPEILPAQQKNYYLSSSGNDAHDGLSIQTAWRTIQRMNKQQFKPGDSILLEGGSVFNGTIKLTSDDNGAPGNYLTISSYGNGKAVINARKRDGVLAVNTSYLQLVSLAITGSGVGSNKGSGIHFYANDRRNAPTDINITDCDVKGFTSYGIVFGANPNISWKGYKNVRITYCTATENGEAGISSYGGNGFQHEDFYIAYCKAFRNRGNLARPKHHNGNGIVMAKIDGVLIEYCDAFENGIDNRSKAGGPVGIWVWMCRNGIIQYCRSWHNYAGATKDGGGFDIDGGASNCILQHNYSYNNEGAGYLLAEFGATYPFTDNIVRFNVSINDGRKNGYGGITVWGAAKDYKVTNTAIYNNTIYLDDKNIVNGTPAAITLLGPHFKNVLIANNIFATNGNVDMIAADTQVNTSAFQLIHNNYYSYSNQYNFQWGKMEMKSLKAWFMYNPKQEKLNGESTFLNIDPIFEKYGDFSVLTATDPGKHYSEKGLLVSQQSELRKTLLPLEVISGYTPLYSIIYYTLLPLVSR